MHGSSWRTRAGSRAAAVAFAAGLLAAAARAQNAPATNDVHQPAAAETESAIGLGPVSSAPFDILDRFFTIAPEQARRLCTERDAYENERRAAVGRAERQVAGHFEARAANLLPETEREDYRKVRKLLLAYEDAIAAAQGEYRDALCAAGADAPASTQSATLNAGTLALRVPGLDAAQREAARSAALAFYAQQNRLVADAIRQARLPPPGAGDSDEDRRVYRERARLRQEIYARNATQLVERLTEAIGPERAETFRAMLAAADDLARKRAAAARDLAIGLRRTVGPERTQPKADGAAAAP